MEVGMHESHLKGKMSIEQPQSDRQRSRNQRVVGKAERVCGFEERDRLTGLDTPTEA